MSVVKNASRISDLARLMDEEGASLPETQKPEGVVREWTIDLKSDREPVDFQTQQMLDQLQRDMSAAVFRELRSRELIPYDQPQLTPLMENIVRMMAERNADLYRQAAEIWADTAIIDVAQILVNPSEPDDDR